jgi:hypothetical protein
MKDQKYPKGSTFMFHTNTPAPHFEKANQGTCRSKTNVLALAIVLYVTFKTRLPHSVKKSLATAVVKAQRSTIVGLLLFP